MATGIAATALATLARLPAAAVIGDSPGRTGVAGTVWNGELGLAGGSRVEWHWAPLRSLTSLGFAVDWHASGSNTDLGGRALLRGERVVLDAVSGSADGSLLAAAAPDLPFRCDLAMQVELPRVALGGGERVIEGTVTSEPGRCAATGAGAMAMPVPALHLSAEHVGQQSRLRLVPALQRRRTLLDGSLTEGGTMQVQLTPEGAAALPFLGIPAGASIAFGM